MPLQELLSVKSNTLANLGVPSCPRSRATFVGYASDTTYAATVERLDVATAVTFARIAEPNCVTCVHPATGVDISTGQDRLPVHHMTTGFE